MNTIEEFFKSRVSFVSLPEYGLISKEMFSPEVYSLDFLKEKVKPICHFLASNDGCFTFFSINIGEEVKRKPNISLSGLNIGKYSQILVVKNHKTKFIPFFICMKLLVRRLG